MNRRTKSLLAGLALAILPGAPSLRAAGPIKAAPPWDAVALNSPPPTAPVPVEIPAPAGVRAVCFQGLPFQEKPSRVFAWLAVPEAADAAHPVPGVVLLHGAGGSADAEWVRQWRDRGYAAIAPDLGGNFPIGKFNAWQRDPEGGPPLGAIPQIGWKVANQWMFHAVADALLAHALLAAQPGVNPQRIGVVGISWGGVVTANLAAADPRLQFAVAIYGCGFISGEETDGSCFVGADATAEQRAAWRSRWDPAGFLPRVTIPMLWLAGADDFAFTPHARRLSYRAAPGPHTLSLLPRLSHDQQTACAAPIVPAFADSILRGGQPLATVSAPTLDPATREAAVTFSSSVPIAHAELVVTRSSGRWQDRKWEKQPATLASSRATATVPDDVTAYFFNLTDERDLTISSEHVEASNSR